MDDLDSLKVRVRELEAEVARLRTMLERNAFFMSQEDLLKEISQRRKERSLAGQRPSRLPWLKRPRPPS